MRVGDRVRIVTPYNPQLDGSRATITQLTEWGAFLKAPAAATGEFRAIWEEMTLDVEYTGECCATCGSMSLIRAGACKVCMNCGESGGCG